MQPHFRHFLKKWIFFFFANCQVCVHTSVRMYKKATLINVGLVHYGCKNVYTVHFMKVISLINTISLI